MLYNCTWEILFLFHMFCIQRAKKNGIRETHSQYRADYPGLGTDNRAYHLGLGTDYRPDHLGLGTDYRPDHLGLGTDNRADHLELGQITGLAI